MLPLLAPNLQACTRKTSQTLGGLRHSFRLFRGLPIVGPHPGEGSMSEARGPPPCLPRDRLASDADRRHGVTFACAIFEA